MSEQPFERNGPIRVQRSGHAAQVTGVQEHPQTDNITTAEVNDDQKPQGQTAASEPAPPCGAGDIEQEVATLRAELSTAIEGRWEAYDRRDYRAARYWTERMTRLQLEVQAARRRVVAQRLAMSEAVESSSAPPDEGGLCVSPPLGEAKPATPHNIEASNDMAGNTPQPLVG